MLNVKVQKEIFSKKLLKTSHHDFFGEKQRSRHPFYFIIFFKIGAFSQDGENLYNHLIYVLND